LNPDFEKKKITNVIDENQNLKKALKEALDEIESLNKAYCSKMNEKS